MMFSLSTWDTRMLLFTPIKKCSVALWSNLSLGPLTLILFQKSPTSLKKKFLLHILKTITVMIVLPPLPHPRAAPSPKTQVCIYSIVKGIKFNTLSDLPNNIQAEHNNRALGLRPSSVYFSSDMTKADTRKKKRKRSQPPLSNGHSNHHRQHSPIISTLSYHAG